MAGEYVAAALACYGGLSALAARRILYPGRRLAVSAGPSWLVPSYITAGGIRVQVHTALSDASAPVCVLQHGLGECSTRLADAAACLRRLGFGVVMMDLPGHGGSSLAATTYGAREARVLAAVLDRLDVARRVSILWGRSTGAATVLRAAAGLPHVRALILECMFDNPIRAIARHAFGRRYQPLLPLLPGTVASISLFLRARKATRFPLDTVCDVPLPLLLVSGSEDRGMPPHAQQRMLARARHHETRVVIVPGAGHYHCFPRQARTFEDWLVRYGFPDRTRPAAQPA